MHSDVTRVADPLAAVTLIYLLTETTAQQPGRHAGRRMVVARSNHCNRHLNGSFSRTSASAGTGISPFWILLELRMTEVVVTTGGIKCAKLQSKRHRQQTNTQLFTGPMPFLSPNQQCQSTEGKCSTEMYTLNATTTTSQKFCNLLPYPSCVLTLRCHRIHLQRNTYVVYIPETY